MTTNQQPLVRPDTAMDSPWWRAVAAGDPGRGLPSTPQQAVQLIVDSSGAYWTSNSNNTTAIPLGRQTPPTAVPTTQTGSSFSTER